MTARWYMVNTIGMATLCLDEADARRSAEEADLLYPRHSPHRAVVLVEQGDADTIEYGKSCTLIERNRWVQALRPILALCLSATQIREAVQRLVDAAKKGGPTC